MQRDDDKWCPPWQLPTAMVLGAVATSAAIAGGIWWILAILSALGALLAWGHIPSPAMHGANVAASRIMHELAPRSPDSYTRDGPAWYLVRWGGANDKRFDTHEDALRFATMLSGSVNADVDVRLYSHYDWPDIGTLPLRAQHWDRESGRWVTEWPAVEAGVGQQEAGAIAAMQARAKALAAAQMANAQNTVSGSRGEN